VRERLRNKSRRVGFRRFTLLVATSLGTVRPPQSLKRPYFSPHQRPSSPSAPSSSRDCSLKLRLPALLKPQQLRKTSRECGGTANSIVLEGQKYAEGQEQEFSLQRSGRTASRGRGTGSSDAGRSLGRSRNAEGHLLTVHSPSNSSNHPLLSPSLFRLRLFRTGMLPSAPSFHPTSSNRASRHRCACT
jgi:hypothetical protein